MYICVCDALWLIPDHCLCLNQVTTSIVSLSSGVNRSSMRGGSGISNYSRGGAALDPPPRLLGYDPVSVHESPKLHDWSWLSSDIRAPWIKNCLPGFVMDVSQSVS